MASWVAVIREKRDPRVQRSFHAPLAVTVVSRVQVVGFLGADPVSFLVLQSGQHSRHRGDLLEPRRPTEFGTVRPPHAALRSLLLRDAGFESMKCMNEFDPVANAA